MSSNIFGYQGVNTPLESLTNGRYNVADYTTLREEVNARLYSLEVKAADTQDLDVSGYISVAASSTHSGYITAAGNGSFGGTLYSTNNLGTAAGLSVAGNAAIGLNLQCNGDELLTGDLTVGGEEILTGDLTVGGVVNVSANGIHFSDNTVQTTAAMTPVSPTLFVLPYFYDQLAGQTFIPPYTTNKIVEINFQYNASCNLRLDNFYCESLGDFPDGVRYVTVCKPNMAAGDYTVTILRPTYSGSNYNFYTTQASSSTYTLGIGKYSVTFVIYGPYAGVPFQSVRNVYVKSTV